MDKLEWVSAEEATRRLAKSYYLRTGIVFEPDRFLDEIQRKFNPNHDPDDGRFTYGPGGVDGSVHRLGGSTIGHSSIPVPNWKPTGIAPVRRIPGGNAHSAPSNGGLDRRASPANRQNASNSPQANPRGGRQQTASDRDIENIRRTFDPRHAERLDLSILHRPAHRDVTPGDVAASFGIKQVDAGTYQQLRENFHARGRFSPKVDGRGSLKCNAMVYDALKWAGTAPTRMAGGRIPSALEWGSPNTTIGRYPVATRFAVPRSGVTPFIVSQLREGDVISDGNHVGLVTLRFGRPRTVSAVPMWSPDRGFGSELPAAGGVVVNDWGFRPGQRVVVRRHNPGSLGK